MDKIHIFERILRRKQRLRLPSDVWLQNRKNLRYLMNYGIVQRSKSRPSSRIIQSRMPLTPRHGTPNSDSRNSFDGSLTCSPALAIAMATAFPRSNHRTPERDSALERIRGHHTFLITELLRLFAGVFDKLAD